MTPEQKERLEYLRSKPLVKKEPSELPIHLTHAHFGSSKGMDKCACSENCNYCSKKEEL